LALSGIYFPARNAILPDIVTPREIGAANALSSVTWSTMLFLGAGLGGLAAGQFGVYFSFILDSLSFVLSALLENQIRYEFTPPADRGKVTIPLAFQQYVDGLRYLRHNADIFFISLHKGAVSLIISGAFQVIMVALSSKVFVIGKQGGTGLGIMFAVVGAGTGIGPIIVRRFTKDRAHPQRVAIALSYALNAVGMLIMMTLVSFPVVLFGMLLRGVGTGIGWVLSSQLLLQLLPNRVRGRVFSTEFAFQTLGNAIGSGVGGWAIDHLAGGIPAMMGWMGALVLIPGALWALWLVFGKPTEGQLADDSILIPRTVLDPPRPADK
jgi:MFS transporter